MEAFCSEMKKTNNSTHIGATGDIETFGDQHYGLVKGDGFGLLEKITFQILFLGQYIYRIPQTELF